MPVWALGSFLPSAVDEVIRLVEAVTEFQCPCGLWGLFYQVDPRPVSRRGNPEPVSMLVRALGSFLLGHWNTTRSKQGMATSAGFNARVGFGVFST